MGWILCMGHRQDAHLIDDETVAKMGHPNSSWVRPGPPVQNCQIVETIEPHGDSNRLYGGTKMKSNMNGDLDDISMAYFWYPFLAIVAMVVAAVAVVIKMV